MEHKKVWEMLDVYHDVELDSAVTAQVRDHLSACPECAGALARREHLTRAISGAVPVRQSEEFIRKVGRLVRVPAEEPAIPLRWTLSATAVALAASVFIMVGLISTPPNEASQPGLISTTFEYELGGPMPVMDKDGIISNHDQVLGSLLEES